MAKKNYVGASVTDEMLEWLDEKRQVVSGSITTTVTRSEVIKACIRKAMDEEA